MPRNIFGNSLPPVEASRDSDIFHDQQTNKDYVFDNGQWNELPQQASSSSLPQPSVEDAGKVLRVNPTGRYELGSEGGIIGLVQVQNTVIPSSSPLFDYPTIASVGHNYNIAQFWLVRTTKTGETRQLYPDSFCVLKDAEIPDGAFVRYTDDGSRYAFPGGRYDILYVSGLRFNEGSLYTPNNLVIEVVSGTCLYPAEEE